MRHPLIRTGALALAALGPILVTGPAPAQTVLSDYESADQAKKAQANAAWRLAFRPGLQVMDQAVAMLGRGGRLPAAEQAKLEALVAQARTSPEPEARRRLWQAVSLLLGRPWNPDQERLGSLALRAAQPVIMESRTAVTLAGLYPAAARTDLRFSLDLVQAVQTSSATPQRGEPVRHLTSGNVAGTLPQSIQVDLTGVADGFYILIARVAGADGVEGELALPVHVQQGMAARHTDLQARLAKVTGHEEAKLAAEYPFALAKALNDGTREVISYDFNAALRRSKEIADALSQGRDIVHRAAGLQNRAYRFTETGELVPYQIYVPRSWTADRKWPVVIALHGANLDETNMLGRADGAMQTLAEARGFIIVAPLGYRINSGYGSPRGIATALGIDPVRLRRSQTDVLAVADRVAAEYNTDPARTYLTGNSMGGGGTWWIGGQYPDRWAAIAPVAFGGVRPEDVPGLSRVPILAVVGDRDELGMLDRVKDAVGVLRAGGVQPDYLEITGGTHASGFDIALPRIFDFFEKHRK